MKTLIAIVLSLFLVGCATTLFPETTHMPTDGPDTRAPYGYEEFCERNPEEC